MPPKRRRPPRQSPPGVGSRAGLGSRVRVLWEGELFWGVVRDYRHDTDEHLLVYEDGDTEWLNITGMEVKDMDSNQGSPSYLKDQMKQDHFLEECTPEEAAQVVTVVDKITESDGDRMSKPFSIRDKIKPKPQNEPHENVPPDETVGSVKKRQLEATVSKLTPKDKSKQAKPPMAIPLVPTLPPNPFFPFVAPIQFQAFNFRTNAATSIPALNTNPSMALSPPVKSPKPLSRPSMPTLMPQFAMPTTMPITQTFPIGHFPLRNSGGFTTKRTPTSVPSSFKASALRSNKRSKLTRLPLESEGAITTSKSMELLRTLKSLQEDLEVHFRTYLRRILLDIGEEEVKTRESKLRKLSKCSEKGS